MARFGFCGPSYTLSTVNADCQECMNFYVETDESGLGKSAQILVGTPGLSKFAQVPGAAQVRGELEITSGQSTGRGFAVIDAELYEVMANGTLVPITNVGNDGNPVPMVASPQQLLVASVGLLYVYQLQAQNALSIGNVAAGVVTPIPAATFPNPVTQVGWADGFFVALVAASAQYALSNSFDATDWATQGSKIISTFADNVVSMIVDHREIWLLGSKSSDPQYDSGNIFPFDSVPGGFIEQGAGAQFATVQFDNSIAWIGQRNDQGGGIAWRANGYTPVRISNHAVETAWSTYPMISDARAFTYQEAGHTHWVINFPSAQVSWGYDAAAGLWHKRGYWNVNTGVQQAALPQCHMLLFGKHLVGDRSSGTIYQQSLPTMTGGAWNFVTDNGNLIHRMRRTPHVSTENEWMRHNQLYVDMETGISPQPPLLDGAGKPRAAQATLRYSDDGGHTWSLGRTKSCGQAGKYKTRVVYRRLGRSRDRVYELTCSDPIPWRIVDAYLKADPGFQSQERLAKQYAKVS